MINTYENKQLQTEKEKKQGSIEHCSMQEGSIQYWFKHSLTTIVTYGIGDNIMQAKKKYLGYIGKRKEARKY